MPRTSGPIQNNGLATTLILAIRNSSTVQIPMVQLEVFIITGNGLPKTPIAHELFSVPPLSNIIKTYSIAGALGYELQADTTSGSDFTANIFTMDENGDLIDAQRVLGSETVPTAAFTPVP
ncbi:hypothetical protein C1I60_16155 [Paenibacillus terrae]|uniref:Uncharacterized protein n=1 Tax=Paenibacillus terrae TaxID=159743 RepID=A0A4U2Q0F7_9BACL|nr:hypothetical protein [Paenibacillus terrae]TKH43054.1 hypothetical protein C1I60_16155 [Paenibacillus terrae]